MCTPDLRVGRGTETLDRLARERLLDASLRNQLPFQSPIRRDGSPTDTVYRCTRLGDAVIMSSLSPVSGARGAARGQTYRTA